MSREERVGGEGNETLILAALETITSEIEPSAVDRLWIFPPGRNGEVESLVVVAALFTDEGEERRRILTADYAVRYQKTKRAVKRVTIRADVKEQGSAPLERVGRVVAGVMRRLDQELAALQPRAVQIGGEVESWGELIAELTPEPTGEGADP